METWPKRSEVASELGVSVSTVRRLERDGTLRTQVDETGATRIDPTSVAAAKASLGGRGPLTGGSPMYVGGGASGEADGGGRGRQAREPQIFAALSRGLTPVQIVCELGVPSEEVLAAMRAWALLIGAWPGPPPPAIVAHLESIDAFTRDLCDALASLASRLAAVEAALKAVPPPR